jgi:DNA (cytosine-5)-methyltransferase 1
MRRRTLQAADLFCGAGGFTTGAERAGVHVALAINHWRTAVFTHQANHPETKHLCARIDDVDPRHDEAVPELDLILASPECTHHSIARGGRPIDDQKRATPWHVCVWAEAKRPKWIVVENVQEFRDWGPIDDRGRPIKARKGEIFAQWIKALESIGYQVDHQLLNAADFGAATKRVRLFIVARRGRSRRDIPWPEPTHAGKWRPAYEIIDWGRPCPSIFSRKRPLAEKTLRRIEAGLRKFVGPFVVTLRRNMDGRSVGDPLATITAGAEHHGLAVPFVVQYHNGPDYAQRTYSPGQPIPTLDTSNRYGIAVPFQFKAMGRSPGLTKSPGDPVPTIVAARENHAIVTPFFLPRQGFHEAWVDKPAKSIEDPLNVITANHGPGHVVVPYLLAINHGGDDDRSHGPGEPLATLTTKTGHSIVAPFLTKYYGTASAQASGEPLDTVTTRDRFGLTLPEISIEGRSPSATGSTAAMTSLLATMAELGVVDIGFRMLDVDELARAQGFPEGYVLYGTKSEQVRQVGNAVCPPVAEALCRTIQEAA